MHGDPKLKLPSNSPSDPRLNVWLSASAGSGKTKVLVDRFLRLLLEGVDPKRILCITFTKAAAAEMTHRIASELSFWSITPELGEKIKNLTGVAPSDKVVNSARQLFSKYLDEQSELQIQTIHSFCQSILKQFPLEAGLSPNFLIVESMEQQRLVAEAKKAWILDADPDLMENLLSVVHELSLDKLISSALFFNNFIADFSESIADEESLINQMKEGMGITKSSLENDPNYIFNIRKSLKNLEQLIGSELPQLKALILLDLETLLDDADSNDAKIIQDIFLTKDGKKRISLLPKAVSRKYPEAEQSMQEIQSLIYDQSEKVKARKISVFTENFIKFAFGFNRQFSKIKSANNCMDYDDLIKISLKLLSSEESGAWVRYKLSNQIAHILIDESQDMSLKQWQIVYALMADSFNHKTIFVVGDPKQSIYSFQGASPVIFEAMQQAIDGLVREAGKPLKKMALLESFRSDPVILDLVDSALSCIYQLNPNYFSIPRPKHFSNLKLEGASIELWPLVISEKIEQNSSPWDVQLIYKQYLLATKILAEQIATNVELYLTSENGKPRDIMILVRKRDALVEDIISSFKARNIPINGIDRLCLNDQLVVQDLLALANFILLPADDYNLACLMKSPILQFTEEDLFVVSQRPDNTENAHAKSLSLWLNLSAMKHHNFSFEAAYSLLSTILHISSLHTPYNLFIHILDVLQIRTKFLARFGLQVNDTIESFLDIALKCEQKNMSLQNFVHFFSTTRIELKIDLDIQRDEVKIMTVHAAKGLQAKIVILPDTTSLPQSKDNVLFDIDNKLVMYSGGSENSNQAYKTALSAIKIKAMEEYYRLLYVALTRASHRLIICGWSDNQTIKPESWYEILKSAAAGR